MKNITVIGTGAYGTALANVLADNGHQVLMYGIVEDQVNDINQNHLNTCFFRSLKINENIKATTDIAAALERAEYVIIGVPTKAIDVVLKNLIDNLDRKVHIINTMKGLDEQSGNVISKKIIQRLSHENILKSYTGLYGPSIAIEVIERKPTCIMICNKDLKVANEIIDLFKNEYFRTYPTKLLEAVEVASAAKNCVALASGILKGICNSDNACASLISMGNSEIYKICKSMKIDVEDYMNFATIGDLILTTTSVKSRNFSYGYKLAQADINNEKIEKTNITVEGVFACKIVNNLIQKHSINTKLFVILNDILYNGKRPRTILNIFN